MFHCTTYDAVKAGKVTDVYFARTREILKAEGLDKRVKAEFIAKSLPREWISMFGPWQKGQFFDPGSRSSRSRGCTPTSACTRRSSSA